MEAYLDNSATTRCSEGAAAMVMKVMREDFGNPSSMHTKGVEAEHYIREAKDFFAKNLKVDEKEIYGIRKLTFTHEAGGIPVVTLEVYPKILTVDSYLAFDVKTLFEKR